MISIILILTTTLAFADSELHRGVTAPPVMESSLVPSRVDDSSIGIWDDSESGTCGVESEG